MPHIDLPPLPGMRALLSTYTDTAGPLSDLGEALLRGPSPLTPARREAIFAYVSRANDCDYCAGTHGAAARHLGFSGESDPLLDALFALADRVRVGGRAVRPEDVERARAAGADDRTIHDTVLIAAAASMFNRYVDGLATLAPPDPAAYDEPGRILAEKGYLLPAPVGDGRPDQAGSPVR
jgi:AhpD family alkylhydroperoxidase